MANKHRNHDPFIFGEVSDEERQEAEIFYAELVGEARPQPRARSQESFEALAGWGPESALEDGPQAAADTSVSVPIQMMLRWPDSNPADATFEGTPIQLPATRRPFLTTTRPTTYQSTIDLRTAAGSIAFNAGASAGRYGVTTSLTAGTTYYLVIPEHVFVLASPDADAPWRRKVRYAEVETAGRVYGLPVQVVGTTLRVTPVGGPQESWGTGYRRVYAMAIVPYLRTTTLARLTSDWQTATAMLRRAVGEYPAFAESQLPPHRPLTAAERTTIGNAHVAPDDFIRFITTGQRTFVDIGGPLYLESMLWDSQTQTWAPPAVRSEYLPVPKRALLTGIEALRDAIDPTGELVVKTGFVPPVSVAAARDLRTVGAERGYRINQTRHMFGDAVDLDRPGNHSFSNVARRRALAEILLPWPDTADAQALRGAFDHVQFERLMISTGATAVSRPYVLHVEKSGYDLPMLGGVYQFKVNELTATDGHVDIRDDLTAANANYADVVAVVPQSGTTKPNAFYDSGLATTGANAVFNAINANPNLESLLTDMDANGQYATINVGPRNITTDALVEQVIREVYTVYGAHSSFLGVTFDLEWYDVGQGTAAGIDATALLTSLVTFIRTTHPGKKLYPIWFGTTVSRMDWTQLQALSDVLVPIYDGASSNTWGATARDEWGNYILNTEVLGRVWDSNRNIREYGHNILVHRGLTGANLTAALSWLGRMSRLYGSSNFAFQFNNYSQNWRARTGNLSPILGEID